jgi:hypothetical protein
VEETTGGKSWVKVEMMRDYVLDDLIRVYILPPLFVYGYLLPKFLWQTILQVFQVQFSPFRLSDYNRMSYLSLSTGGESRRANQFRGVAKKVQIISNLMHDEWLFHELNLILGPPRIFLIFAPRSIFWMVGGLSNGCPSFISLSICAELHPVVIKLWCGKAGILG